MVINADLDLVDAGAALAAAVPAMVTVPDTLLPSAGCVMLTEGDGTFPKIGNVPAVQAFARQGSPRPCSTVATVE